MNNVKAILRYSEAVGFKVSLRKSSIIDIALEDSLCSVVVNSLLSKI